MEDAPTVPVDSRHAILPAAPPPSAEVVAPLPVDSEPEAFVLNAEGSGFTEVSNELASVAPVRPYDSALHDALEPKSFEEEDEIAAPQDPRWPRWAGIAAGASLIIVALALSLRSAPSSESLASAEPPATDAAPEHLPAPAPPPSTSASAVAPPPLTDIPSVPASAAGDVTAASATPERPDPPPSASKPSSQATAPSPTRSPAPRDASPVPKPAAAEEDEDAEEDEEDEESELDDPPADRKPLPKPAGSVSIDAQASASALAEQGNALFNQGKFGDASKVLAAAVRKDPRNARLQLLLGDAYFKLDKLDQARTQYLKARDLGHEAAERRLRKLDQ